MARVRSLALWAGVWAVLLGGGVLSAETSSQGASVRLVVDPGHGGKDGGAKGPGGVLEKEVALTLAKELRDEARSIGGFQVRLTREEDETFPWVRRRGASSGADVWVSLHLNADFDGKARGPRIFYPHGGALGETRGDGRDDQRKPATDVNAILQDMSRTKWENESVLLAEHLQRSLDAAWGLGSRASKPAPMDGFQELECPAVLVEVGFLTHQADHKVLTDPSRRRHIVKAVLRGVRSFLQDPRRSQ